MEINSSLKLALGLTVLGLLWMAGFSYWTITASKLEIVTAEGAEICRADIISTTSEIKKARKEGVGSDCTLVLLARERNEKFDWGEQSFEVSYLNAANKAVDPTAGYRRMLVGQSLATDTKVRLLGAIPRAVEVEEVEDEKSPMLP